MRSRSSAFLRRACNRAKAIPRGVWLAFSAALMLLLLALRGRRIEAELAHAKTRLESSRARAEAETNREKAVRYHAEAIQHAQQAEALEAARALIRVADVEHKKTLAALPPAQVHLAYLELAARKRAAREAEKRRYGRSRS